MQITNQPTNAAQQTSDRTLNLREGEVYRATVKERLPNNEAILQIRGREVHTRFEGAQPPTDRVTIQVSENRQGIPVVRSIGEERSGSTVQQGDSKDIQRVLRNLGVSQSPTPELRQAAQTLLDKGVPLTREAVQELQRYFNSNQGTVDQRQQTIQAMANKRLEVTPAQVRAVHEALHGRPINQVLSSIAQEMNSGTRVNSESEQSRQSLERQVSEAVRRFEQLQRTEASRVTVENNRVEGNSARQPVAENVRSIEQRPPADQRASDQLRQVREQVQREPNVQRAIEHVRQQVLTNQQLPQEVREQVNRAVEEARTQTQRGQETAVVRERLVQAITQVEREVASRENNQRIEGNVARQQAPEPVRAVEQRPPADQRASDQLRQVREQVQRDPNVQRAIEHVRQQVLTTPGLNREAVQAVERASREARQLVQVSQDRMVQSLQAIEKQLSNQPKSEENTRASEAIRDVRDQLSRDQNVQRSVEQLRNHLSNQTFDRNTQQQVERAINQTQQIENVSKERLSQALVTAEKATVRAETAGTNQPNQTVNHTSQGQSNEQRLSEALRQMQQLLQKEANFDRAVEQMKLQINQNSNSNTQMIDKLTKATDESKQLSNQGREMAARQQLMQTLQQLEQQAIAKEQTQSSEANRQPLESNQYIANEQFQTGVQLNSKDIAVTTITEKLAQAAADFKNLQREITRNLDVANRLMDQFKNQAQHQVKPLLETTIKKLDNAILKSEMMLLTDMKTEKRLMQASSQLAEAKKLLSKGQYQEANRIVQEVKGVVERLQFKPSETKVMHYISNERQVLESRTPTQHVMSQLNEGIKPNYGQEASARQAFEMVRGLGLNRDSELGMLLANSREQSQQEANQRNLKAALMTLMRGEEENSRLGQQANQAVNNITGQQLLSKSDQGNLQSMFFNLPFLLEEQVENLQVFVNSRNEGQQVDWENCNLYFLIDTPKLGEVGIMVSVVDRNLSVTLKNNQPMFETKMEPLVDQCVDNIKEIGYNVNGIKYTKLATNNEKEDTTIEEVDVPNKSQQPIFTEKGFDYKI
ncbi:hypothetical protein [Alkalihalobacterium chitinilyticum]|uniref:Flagellar hook-length control protein-like C-terminal domain-containing protein n=1 Tax=Alkalihalobacterium chitinilyticum TaxID=2980103 RepID=A0ABT5V9Q4_9BACI|nr:hypothetical protein [Alkalihalobacterium chitinilyticum]MDE5412193.1 hypothetical protein [Alkalihalobacterium chitinilyticum]